jgi:hypothetical protein
MTQLIGDCITIGTWQTMGSVTANLRAKATGWGLHQRRKFHNESSHHRSVKFCRSAVREQIIHRKRGAY